MTHCNLLEPNYVRISTTVINRLCVLLVHACVKCCLWRGDKLTHAINLLTLHYIHLEIQSQNNKHHSIRDTPLIIFVPYRVPVSPSSPSVPIESLWSGPLLADNTWYAQVLRVIGCLLLIPLGSRLLSELRSAPRVIGCCYAQVLCSDSGLLLLCSGACFFWGVLELFATRLRLQIVPVSTIVNGN